MGNDFVDGFVHAPPKMGHRPALVLNADYRPLSYLPLSLWSWQDAIKASYLDRVDVLAQYDDYVHAPTQSIRVPSVIVLRDYVKPKKTVAFTRFNLFLRDEFRCQYCGIKGEMTFDHIIPRCRGGRTNWENVVAACAPCNLKKGARTLQGAGMRLLRDPICPDMHQLRNAGRKFPSNHLHESWLDFLYWDSELEA